MALPVVSAERQEGRSAAPWSNNRNLFASLGLNAAIVSLWLWLFWPVGEYLRLIFSRDDFRTSQWALLAVIGLLAFKLYRRSNEGADKDADVTARRLSPRRLLTLLASSPRPHRLPLLLVFLSTVGYWLIERYLDVNTLSASLFILGGYGLAGLWVEDARRWRAQILFPLLLVGLLPFGEHLQTFLGYPARLFTAESVRRGLALFGASPMGVDTILLLENSVSQVDLPCAGIRSFWAGLLFLVGASWARGARLGLRFCITALILMLLLLFANTLRVAALVVVSAAFPADPILADLIHAPLGVLGFVLSCVAILPLIREGISRSDREESEDPPRASRKLGLALAAMLLVLCLGFAEKAPSVLAESNEVFVLSSVAGLRLAPLPLSEDERRWLSEDGAESAERWRFTWFEPESNYPLAGSLMLVTSSTWLAQHLPERCFDVYGLSLDESSAYLLSPDRSIRLIHLGKRQGKSLGGAYWFQSAGRTTDDYATRIWADLTPRPERWVMVSLLFDEIAIDPSGPDTTNESDGWSSARTPEARSFYLALHGSVSTLLGQ